MHVNELAKRAGVQAHVIRYYTQTGLLHPSREERNRYRCYVDSDVYRVRFIKRSQSIGFTLGDIKRILDAADQGSPACPDVRKMIIVRARENHARLDELMRLQQRVEQSIATWQSMPDRPPDKETLCHLIDSVGTWGDDLT